MEIATALAQRGVRLRGPQCGSGEYAIAPGFVWQGVHDPTLLSLHAPLRNPAVCVTCLDCGALRFFSAVVLGLTQQQGWRGP